jgi:hypothetical protein
MVLEKIGKLVVKEHRRIKICRDIEFDNTLLLCGDVSNGGVVGIV